MRLVSGGAMVASRGSTSTTTVSTSSAAFAGSLDVHFDGWRGWSVGSRTPAAGAPCRGPSGCAPARGHRRRPRHRRETRSCTRARWASAPARAASSFVDRSRHPGHHRQVGPDPADLRRRREAGAVEAMIDVAERVLAGDARRLRHRGLDLLRHSPRRGPRRQGHRPRQRHRPLLPLREQTPAEMAVEIWDVARALVDAGISVQHKTASFITVRLRRPRRRRGRHRHLHLLLRRRPAPRDRHRPGAWCPARRSCRCARWSSRAR